jgi:hypothetical protein
MADKVEAGQLELVASAPKISDVVSSLDVDE